jgi:hypothetical protein
MQPYHLILGHDGTATVTRPRADAIVNSALGVNGFDTFGLGQAVLVQLYLPRMLIVRLIVRLLVRVSEYAEFSCLKVILAAFEADDLQRKELFL